ncbi:MAG: hypothetical protein ACYC4F_11520, partial [Armatimonadota bacterium]
PGRVRVTGCDASENLTSGDVWDYNSKGSNTLRNLWIDGTSDGRGVVGTNGSTTCLLESCYVSGQEAIRYVTASNCVTRGSYYGARQSVLTNCIVFGGYAGLNYCTATNVLCIGGINAVTDVNTCINVVAMFCRMGFYGASTLVVTNGLAVCCDYGAYGTSNTSPIDVSSITASSCHYLQRGSGYEVGTVSAGKQVTFDYVALIYALQPILASGMKDVGTATGAPATDILGRERVGTPDVGPWELPVTALSAAAGNYRHNPPGIVVTGTGEHILRLPVQKGQIYTVSVQVKCVGMPYPRLVVRGGDLSEHYMDASADALTDWEDVSLSFTAVCDAVVDVVLKSRGTSAIFSDVRAVAAKHGTLYENMLQVETTKGGRLAG